MCDKLGECALIKKCELYVTCQVLITILGISPEGIKIEKEDRKK